MPGEGLCPVPRWRSSHCVPTRWEEWCSSGVPLIRALTPFLRAPPHDTSHWVPFRLFFLVLGTPLRTHLVWASFPDPGQPPGKEEAPPIHRPLPATEKEAQRSRVQGRGMWLRPALGFLEMVYTPLVGRVCFEGHTMPAILLASTWQVCRVRASPGVKAS